MVLDMADKINEDQDLALVEALVAGPGGIVLERIEATPATSRRLSGSSMPSIRTTACRTC
jgi:hypothetical protein